MVPVVHGLLVISLDLRTFLVPRGGEFTRRFVSPYFRSVVLGRALSRVACVRVLYVPTSPIRCECRSFGVRAAKKSVARLLLF